MCEMCAAPSEPQELNAETLPQMLSEATEAATAAAEHYSRGWTAGAKGLVSDIVNRWETSGLCRMTWTWASIRFFMPKPDEYEPIARGFAAVRERLSVINDSEPTDAEVSQLVHTQEQLSKAINDLTKHASTGDLATYMEVFEHVQEADNLRPLAALLLSEAAVRFAWSQKVGGDETNRELLCAHLNADLDHRAEEGGEQAA